MTALNTVQTLNFAEQRTGIDARVAIGGSLAGAGGVIGATTRASGAVVFLIVVGPAAARDGSAHREKSCEPECERAPHLIGNTQLPRVQGTPLQQSLLVEQSWP